jgi:hypothetical protein
LLPADLEGVLVRFLGIDPAAGKGVALAWIDDGGINHRLLDVSGEVGARRLGDIRRMVRAELVAMPPAFLPACVVVEIPWSRPPNFALIGSAAMCLEAAQDAAPGAVVMEVPTQNWKREAGLPGNAGKPAVMALAGRLGYRGDDQDVADALVMALVAQRRWERAVAA